MKQPYIQNLNNYCKVSKFDYKLFLINISKQATHHFVVLGETKAVIKEEPNPYEQQYFGETNQEIEYIEVKEESREIDEVQEWKPHIKSEADEDLETNFMISNKEIRKIMEGQKLQIKSEVEICEEEEPSINSSYNVHTTDVLEHDVQCESSRERDTLGEDYESCSAMEDKKCVEGGYTSFFQ